MKTIVRTTVGEIDLTGMGRKEFEGPGVKNPDGTITRSKFYSNNNGKPEFVHVDVKELQGP